MIRIFYGLIACQMLWFKSKLLQSFARAIKEIEALRFFFSSALETVTDSKHYAANGQESSGQGSNGEMDK